MSTSDAELIRLARTAASGSIKNFTVQQRTEKTEIGAAVDAGDGERYTGTIIETRDRMQTIHAERLAVAKALADGADGVERIAVYATTEKRRICGGCLQFIHEFSAVTDPDVLLAGPDGEVERYSLSDLYPRPWPPRYDDG